MDQLVMLNDSTFYKEKRVLVTGHTGFKGSWLALWLSKMGAEVVGIALDPKQELDNFNCTKLADKVETVIQDIRDYDKVGSIFKEFKPEVVFHLAAQALVGYSYENPRSTFETNVMGTLNILESIRHTPSVKSGVMITSDKCYRNIEQVWGYKETDILGGPDPYSASKGCAELLIDSYIQSYFHEGFPLIASTRAGNVIGGGDWSVHRIVPDCFRALFENKAIEIRSPEATRPWQFVLEPLRAYLMLGEKLYGGDREFSTSWNFGPNLDRAYNVEEVTREIIKTWGSGELDIRKNADFHECGLLQLDCAKARTFLKWVPLLNFEECIRFTTEWYQHLNQGDNTNKDMYAFGIKQINEYEQIGASR
jgi:CDP-glucose 4,6-dehydratase